MGRPLAITSTAANSSEQEQVVPLLEKISKFLNPAISRGITPIVEADKGYDSRLLRMRVLMKKVFSWIPYRGDASKKTGIRYLEKFRWQVERGISWLQRKFIRLNIRWERKMCDWKGFLELGLILFGYRK
jgi:hypothetical protein